MTHSAIRNPRDADTTWRAASRRFQPEGGRANSGPAAEMRRGLPSRTTLPSISARMAGWSTSSAGTPRQSNSPPNILDRNLIRSRPGLHGRARHGPTRGSTDRAKLRLCGNRRPATRRALMPSSGCNERHCALTLLAVKQCIGGRGAEGSLGGLTARFSFKDFPDFLLMACRGDLSDITGPLDHGGLIGPDTSILSLSN